MHRIKMEWKYALYVWNLGSQSIVLYWVIRFCSWRGWVFDCLQIASGVMMYSLRKPCWTSSFRYLRRAQQWRLGALSSRGMRSITPTREVRNYAGSVSGVWPIADVWWYWRFHWSKASMEWSVPSICNFVVDLVSGSRALTSCKQVTFGVSLECGRELREWISISLHHRSISWSDWRRPPSSLLAKCKVELEKGPRSSWQCCASWGAI